MIRPVLIVSLALGITAHRLPGQNFASPSVHFGAMSWPALEPEVAAVVNLDRFTEFDGEGRRYNALHETVGLDLLAVSMTRPLRLTSLTLVHGALAVGVAWDQPTRFLQNQFLHGIRRFAEVPVGHTEQGAHGAASLELTQLLPVTPLHSAPFVDLGGTASSVASDLWIETGWRAPPFGLSAMVRAGVPIGGSAFPNRYLADDYVLALLSVRLPLDDWAAGLPAGGIIPAIEVSLTQSSGYFRRATGGGFHERFCSLRLTWGVAAFETWNDLCGGKDRGPTYGARLELNVRSLNPGRHS